MCLISCDYASTFPFQNSSHFVLKRHESFPQNHTQHFVLLHALAGQQKNTQLFYNYSQIRGMPLAYSQWTSKTIQEEQYYSSGTMNRCTWTWKPTCAFCQSSRVTQTSHWQVELPFGPILWAPVVRDFSIGEWRNLNSINLRWKYSKLWNMFRNTCWHMNYFTGKTICVFPKNPTEY